MMDFANAQLPDLTRADVAKRLKCSEWKVKSLVRLGKLAEVKLGRMVRYRLRDLEKLGS